jgi:predicted nucleic acid-binding protein
MSVAYVDANVFVYAFLKPKRKLEPHEVKIKQAAKKIVSRINDGEKVAPSVVHFSEVCNILDDYLPIGEALLIEKGLLFSENILVCEVSKDDYLKAISVTEDQQVEINDALAYVLMKKEAIQTVYSFDKDFDAFTDISRIIE